MVILIGIAVAVFLLRHRIGIVWMINAEIRIHDALVINRANLTNITHHIHTGDKTVTNLTNTEFTHNINGPAMHALIALLLLNGTAHMTCF